MATNHNIKYYSVEPQLLVIYNKQIAISNNQCFICHISKERRNYTAAQQHAKVARLRGLIDQKAEKVQ